MRRFSGAMTTCSGVQSRPLEKNFSAIRGQDPRCPKHVIPGPPKHHRDAYEAIPSELAKLTALNQAASEQARVRDRSSNKSAKLEALEKKRVRAESLSWSPCLTNASPSKPITF